MLIYTLGQRTLIPVDSPVPFHIKLFGEEEMVTEYKHTQVGVVTFIVLLVVGVLIAPMVLSILADGRMAIAILTMSFYILVLAMFLVFTVQISGNKLSFWFGIEGLGKSYSLDEIQSTQEVKNPWYYFWGIKSIPNGWLFAIAPGRGVEIVFKNGKIIRLGSNQPKKLRQAIEDAITAIKQ